MASDPQRRPRPKKKIPSSKRRADPPPEHHPSKLPKRPARSHSARGSKAGKSASSRDQVRLPRILREPRKGLLALALRLLITTVLFIFSGVTTVVFFQQLSAVNGMAFLTSPALFAFLLGSLVFATFQWGFPATLLYIYVFAHELTHVAFIYLCGGKVIGPIHVSAKGGHVVTNKSNLLISLSPYIVPFYTVIIILSSVTALPFIDINKTLSVDLAGRRYFFQLAYILYALIGLTWTQHFYYTAKMVHKDQPDLQMNGRVLSMTFIYLVNLLVIATFMISVSRALTFKGFAGHWLDLVYPIWKTFLITLAKIIW